MYFQVKVGARFMVAGEKSQPLRLIDSLVSYLKNINIDIFTLILYFFKFKPFNVVFFYF